MAARSALSRIAPVLSKASRSGRARRTLQAARGYATVEGEHSVCRITRIYPGFSHSALSDDRSGCPQCRHGGRNDS